MKVSYIVTGRWVFPSRSDIHDPPSDPGTYKSVYDSATPSSASGATPTSTPFTTPSSASDSVWLRQYSSGSVLPTVFEDSSPVDTREVDVEIHVDRLSSSDVGMTVAEQSLQQQQENSGVEDVAADPDEETNRHMDNGEPAEAKEISL